MGFFRLFVFWFFFFLFTSLPLPASSYVSNIFSIWQLQIYARACVGKKIIFLFSYDMWSEEIRSRWTNDGWTNRWIMNEWNAKRTNSWMNVVFQRKENFRKFESVQNAQFSRNKYPIVAFILLQRWWCPWPRTQDERNKMCEKFKNISERIKARIGDPSQITITSFASTFLGQASKKNSDWKTVEN